MDDKTMITILYCSAASLVTIAMMFMIQFLTQARSAKKDELEKYTSLVKSLVGDFNEIKNNLVNIHYRINICNQKLGSIEKSITELTSNQASGTLGKYDVVLESPKPIKVEGNYDE